MTFEFVSEFLGSKQEEHASGQLTDCFPASVLTSLRLRLFVYCFIQDAWLPWAGVFDSSLVICFLSLARCKVIAHCFDLFPTLFLVYSPVRKPQMFPHYTQSFTLSFFSMNNNSIIKKTLIFKNCITKLFDSEINKLESNSKQIELFQEFQ